MKMTAAVVVAGLLATLVVPTPVHAADKKKVVGAVLAAKLPDKGQSVT